MIIPIKVSGIEFTPEGNRLFSKWLPDFVDETITIHELYELADTAIADDKMPFTSVKRDTLFLVSSHKQIPLGIEECCLTMTLHDTFPQISEDHYIIIWVRQ